MIAPHSQNYFYNTDALFVFFNYVDICPDDSESMVVKLLVPQIKVGVPNRSSSYILQCQAVAAKRRGGEEEGEEEEEE